MPASAMWSTSPGPSRGVPWLYAALQSNTSAHVPSPENMTTLCWGDGADNALIDDAAGTTGRGLAVVVVGAVVVVVGATVVVVVGAVVVVTSVVVVVDVAAMASGPSPADPDPTTSATIKPPTRTH